MDATTTVFSLSSSPPGGIVAPQTGDGAIAGNHQQPAGKRAARRIELRGVAPQLVENVLQNFLGSLRVAQNPVQDGREHAGVTVVERGKR